MNLIVISDRIDKLIVFICNNEGLKKTSKEFGYYCGSTIDTENWRLKLS